jgi:outer membrane protein OmpA-like peptidoglycan-associated protein
MNFLKPLVLGTAIAIISLPTASVFAEDAEYNTLSNEIYKDNSGNCWKGRFFTTEKVKVDCAAHKSSELNPGEAILILNAKLLFKFDSAELTAEAKSEIDKPLERYKGKGELTQNVQVVGFTDSAGSEEYNQKLSEKRAQAVATYLESHSNITDKEIEVVGMGESHPTHDNNTEVGRTMNRRVEIHVRANLSK